MLPAMLWPCPYRGCLGGCVRLANLERRTPSIFGNAKYSQKTEVEPEHDPVKKKGDYVYIYEYDADSLIILYIYYVELYINNPSTNHVHESVQAFGFDFRSSNMSICLAYSYQKVLWQTISGFLCSHHGNVGICESPIFNGSLHQIMCRPVLLSSGATWCDPPKIAKGL